jgi:hypothetical protein
MLDGKPMKRRIIGQRTLHAEKHQKKLVWYLHINSGARLE